MNNKQNIKNSCLICSLVAFFLLSMIWEFGIKDSILPVASESHLQALIAYLCIFALSLSVLTLTLKSGCEEVPDNSGHTSSDELAQTIFHHAHDAIITIDTGSRITRWNKMAEKIFGWDQKEVLNKKLTDFIIPAKFRDEHDKGIAHFISSGEGPVLNSCIELTGMRKNGTEVPIELTISAIPWQDSFIFSGIIRDISERKKMEHQLQKNQIKLEENNQLLQKLSTEDSLTLIHNRRFFDDFLHNEWKRATRDKYPISLVMIDIDFFKPYNDIYGHQSGDDCLKKVAKAIKDVLHRPADIVARYGGEEFVIVLPETEKPGALKISEEIRNRIEMLKIKHSGNKASSYVTASLGIETIIPDGESKDTKLLIQRADQALYQAKSQGKNRAIVYNATENLNLSK
ncbi:MAG: diguanylate cyclase [Nitrospinae bacterium]|nr:diguanylate cyclase [Nitrospinota bacterium]MBL7020044.1 diguanylate cyclase [Nitrospinaceae bacterium]